MKEKHIIVACLLTGTALAASVASAASGVGEARQAQVARAGAAVMPFDLSRTTHFFDDNPSGGVETVTANDKDDSTQIGLIRVHLRTEAQRFGRGDFSDPAKIHGNDMPGLAAMAAAGGKLLVRYQELPSGASLTYVSIDPTVAAAVHDWFAAQRADHAAHEHMHR